MDLRADITNTIISMIEQGAGEWQRPWSRLAALGLPRNLATGRAYQGINVLLLWHAVQSRGLGRSDWLTFRQARAMGRHVHKGAKGVMCIFYQMAPRKSGASDDDGADGPQGSHGPALKPFWLFNADDIDGLPVRDTSAAQVFEPIREAEMVLMASGAAIAHGGDHAYYDPVADAIRLPFPEVFRTQADYYGTALHELTHWTGHPGRLAREFGKRFGDAAYAFEELVAEIGSAYVLADLGLVDSTLAGHASYLQSWLKVLRRDKTAIFSAARHASAAHALISELAADAAVQLAGAEGSAPAAAAAAAR